MNTQQAPALTIILLLAATAQYQCGVAAEKNASPGDRSTGLFWGATSNGLKAGIFCDGPEIQVEPESGKLLGRPCLTLTNVTTKEIRFYLPPAKERDEFILTDAQGRLVPKTSAGKLLGLPVSTNGGNPQEGLEPQGLSAPFFKAWRGRLLWQCR
jgi:hypothetical protein